MGRDSGPRVGGLLADARDLDVFAEEPVTGGRRVHGEVMVASLVSLYKKLKFGTDENIGWGPIRLPELELQTTAYWLSADRLAGAWTRAELDVALIGAGRAIGRWFARILAAAGCLGGFGWALFDPERRTWHGRVTRRVLGRSRPHPAGAGRGDGARCSHLL